MTRELTATIREEDGSFWAEVQELPGCFASGETLDELLEALKEAIGMCLEYKPESALVATEIHVSVPVPT